MKRCPKCNQEKPAQEFYANKARCDGLSSWCVSCMKTASTKSRVALRTRTLEYLGGRCVTCGYDDFRALHIDHINSDGATERRSGVVAAMLYNRILEGAEGYQLLCANCNMIKRHEQAEHVGDRIYRRTVPDAPRANERWTPEQRARQAERQRKKFDDPTEREAVGERLRQLWQDPEFRERQRREQSERMKARWASGEVPTRPKT